MGLIRANISIVIMNFGASITSGTVDVVGAGELRLVNGAGHRLRHDPRAVAVLLGWLERQTL